MESMDLGMLIVGVICGIGMVELIMWLVVVIKHPGWDYLRPDLVQTVSTQPSVADSSQRSYPSVVGK